MFLWRMEIRLTIYKFELTIMMPHLEQTDRLLSAYNVIKRVIATVNSPRYSIIIL